jgi:NADH:ubiquinone reductase (non-electrogenic)
MALTPLLASATCSIFNFRIAEEPLRRLGNAGKVVKYQVHVSSVELGKRVVRRRAAVGSNRDARLIGKSDASDSGFSEDRGRRI